MISKVTTIDDVVTFTKAVLMEGTNFHPDEDFHNYVVMETNEPAYSPADADIRNRLLLNCFKVCEKEGADIYDIAQEVFLKETGLDKYIPLPSSL